MRQGKEKPEMGTHRYKILSVKHIIQRKTQIEQNHEPTS